MCGRYTFTFTAESLTEAFGLVPPGFTIRTGYNLTPGQSIVILWPEVMVSACIITTEPNELMVPIHNRMPVLLPQETWPLWLDLTAQTRELRPLLVSCPADRMAAHPLGMAVGNVNHDGPELIAPTLG